MDKPKRKPVYTIGIDPDDNQALTIINLDTCEIVVRGILPADGITAWGIAKSIREKMNAD